MLTKLKSKKNPRSLFEDMAHKIDDDINEVQRKILIDKIKKGKISID
jgi:hypothetical protein